MQVDKLDESHRAATGSASQNAGFVFTPRATGAVINRIEIVSVQIIWSWLFWLVGPEPYYQKKIKLENTHSQEDFYKISRYLNQMLKGYEIEDIKEKGLAFFMDSNSEMGDLGNTAMLVAQSLIYMPPDQQVLLEGEATLYKRLARGTSLISRQAEKLVRILDDKDFLIELLNSLSQIEESMSRLVLRSMANIFPAYLSSAAHYSVGGRNIGSLGVIGINRMPYEQIIRSMDYSSEILSNVLKKLGELDFNGEIKLKMGKLPERIFY